MVRQRTALRGARESWSSSWKAFDPLGRESFFPSRTFFKKEGKRGELARPQLRWSWFAIESFPKPATRRLERPQRGEERRGVFLPSRSGAEAPAPHDFPRRVLVAAKTKKLCFLISLEAGTQGGLFQVPPRARAAQSPHERTAASERFPGGKLFSLSFLSARWVGSASSDRHARGGSHKRKMRSKIRWLAGFCNSHYVSHFAAFFIVVGAKTSITEMRFLL